MAKPDVQPPLLQDVEEEGAYAAKHPGKCPVCRCVVHVGDPVVTEQVGGIFQTRHAKRPTDGYCAAAPFWKAPEYVRKAQ